MVDLKRLIIKHEGLRLYPYVDTVGKITIGVGRNLTDRGITEAEAMVLFENDLKIAEGAAKQCAKDYGIDFDSLPENIKCVLIDMAFNMGYFRLKSFKRMFSCVKREDYRGMAEEMMDSLWAKQVGKRAEELRDLVLSP